MTSASASVSVSVAAVAVLVVGACGPRAGRDGPRLEGGGTAASPPAGRDAASCPEDARPGFALPSAPSGGPGARFVIRRASGNAWDQPSRAECVTQDGRMTIVRHGTAGEFAVPASTEALTQIGFGARRFLVSIPAGEALELVSNPCSSFKLEGTWLDASEHSEQATPHEFCRTAAGWIRAGEASPDCRPVAYAPSELVILLGECSVDRARRVTAACEGGYPLEVTSDCVVPAQAGYCTPVRIEGARTTAELLLGYGERFAVCLDADREVTRTLRLPRRQ